MPASIGSTDETGQNRGKDMAKLKELYQKYKEIILYFIFGGLTTVVSFAVTFLMQKVFGLSGEDFFEFFVSNGVAWVCAVAFAYVTSHLYVFQSKAHGAKAIAIEAGKFVGSRLFTGVIEMLLPSVLVKIGIDAALFSFEGFWAKAITGVVVIILNYILSKLFVFRKAKEQPDVQETNDGKQ